MEMFIIVIPVILIILVFLVISIYNSLVTLRQRTEESWSDIDVQLKRRYDLIPNLVETVKGYAKHEKEVFENVTKARAAMMGAGSMKEKVEADTVLSGALKSLFAVAEAYPQLQANTNFQDLQRQLGDTEDKVAYSRQFYNSNVLDFNTKIQMFPTNLLAGMFNFKMFEFFQATEEEKKKIEVKF